MPFQQGRLWLLSALVGIMSVAPASANEKAPTPVERGWYLGILGGQASGEVTDDEMNRRMAGEGYAVEAQVNDLDRTAYSLLAGYRWSRHVSLEAAYTDLGEVTTTLYGNPSDINDFLNSADRVHPASADGLELSFLGRYPLSERLDIYGRMGVMLADSHYEAKASTGERDNLADDGQLHLMGVGLDYALTQRWTVRASATRYSFDDEDVDFLGLGVLYLFPERDKPKEAAPPPVMPMPVAKVEPTPAPRPTPTLTEQLQAQGLAAQQTERGVTVTLGGVLFATNSAELNDNGKVSVNKIAGFMRESPSRTLVVEGHTDNQGRAAANQILSERRAESVKQALITAGISAERILARGYGSRYPVADNNDEAGRQKNRRVEFLFSSESGAIIPERTR